MAKGSIDAADLKRLYAEKKNILEHMRQQRGIEDNDELAVLYAYDLQAGSYIQRTTQEPEIARRNDASTARLTALFDELGGGSVLDAGTGEATFLCHVIGKMKTPPSAVYGFDISLSRLLYARAFAAEQGLDTIRFFTGSLTRVPVQDDAFDIVFTNHALEPNRGREREIIGALARTSRRYLVLREPSYEKGDAKTREHIDRHRYVKGIPDVLADLGFDVVRHELFGDDVNPNSQAAVTVVRTGDAAAGAPLPDPPFASPVGCGALAFTGEAYYSAEDCLIFPVIDGIPCLLPENGIFSTKYLEAREKSDDD